MRSQTTSRIWNDAIPRMQLWTSGKLRLTMAEGWECVLPKHGEDDPGVLICWDDDNIAATVTQFNAAITAGNATPAPAFLGDHPFTISSLKMALLTHMQTRGGGGGVVGNMLIAPNTVAQYNNVHRVASHLDFEPFVMANAVVPIGRFYILKDEKNPNTATRHVVVPPPAGLGVALFE